jgi:hypothetical protein
MMNGIGPVQDNPAAKLKHLKLGDVTLAFDFSAALAAATKSSVAISKPQGMNQFERGNSLPRNKGGKSGGVKNALLRRRNKGSGDSANQGNPRAEGNQTSKADSDQVQSRGQVKVAAERSEGDPLPTKGPSNLPLVALRKVGRPTGQLTGNDDHQPRSEGDTKGILGGEKVVKRFKSPQRRQAQQQLREMNPLTEEASKKAALEDGEKTGSKQLSDMMNSKSIKPSERNPDHVDQGQAHSQDVAELNGKMTEIEKSVGKGVTSKGATATGKGQALGGMRRAQQPMTPDQTKAHRNMAKQLAQQAKARFEAALNKTDSGQTTVRVVDAELGTLEANIILSGNDLSIKLRAHENALRQGMGDILAEIKRELKAAELVTGNVDVSEDEESRQSGSDPSQDDSAAENYHEEADRRSAFSQLA